MFRTEHVGLSCFVIWLCTMQVCCNLVRDMSSWNDAILHVISTPPSRRLLQQREETCPKEAAVALEAAIHRRAYGGAFPQ